VLVDVQNTLVVNALMRWGNDDIKRRYLTRLASNTVGAYALSEAARAATPSPCDPREGRTASTT
jgi:butyryl-CoA dehydrogenase/short/branched chain acyl-CoA dehydrogenase